jgi:amino-acid N-acetyltransferase
MAQPALWSIRQPWGEEWSRYRCLLRHVRLPAHGVDPRSGCLYLVAVDQAGRVAGGVGLEGLGPEVLLRSLAVAVDYRRAGLGSHLLVSAEKAAAAGGAKRIFLLTTTAKEFFASRGYREIPRKRAPAPIRATEEFATLCPASARLMVRRVSAGSNDRQQEGQLH